MGRIKDDYLKTHIIINGNPAKKELGELEVATKNLKNENKDLILQKKKLIASGKKESEEYDKVTAAIKLNNSEIKKNEARMKELRGEIGLTGLTMKQLRAESKRLRYLRDSVTPGTEAWKKYDAELQQVLARMKQVNNQSARVGTSLGKIADGFNRFAALGATVIATLTGISFGFKKLVDDYIKLTDNIADVQKTTGMAKEGVEELHQELLKINTRTSGEELLGLSRIAGKLGVDGKENILGFTEAADKLVVALGEDLGGETEETIRQVGKLVEIFGVEDEFGLGDGMLKIGSAINSLGASSTANEGYLVEFTKRMGGVSKQANISVQDILGYGASLDILGQSTELSATALNKVVVDMFVDTAEYARIAGMSLDDFTKLLNTDSNEAMIKFFEGLNGNNEGLTQLAEKLDIVGQDGARSTQVLATLAGNTELLREQQTLANKEFDKGTSLQEEFNVKNETMAAKLDKAKKSAQTVREELGEKLAPAMASMVGWGTKMLKVFSIIIDFFFKYKNIIIPTTAAIIAYVAAVKLKAIWDKKTELGNRKLLESFKKLWTTIKANPYAAVASALAAIAIAIYRYMTNVKEATSKQELYNDALAEAKKNMADERSELTRLLTIANDETIAKEKRQKAIEELNRISPKYLGNLTLENLKTKEGLDAINNYIEALERKALAQALSDKMSELYSKRIEIETQKLNESVSAWDRIAANFNAFESSEKKSLNLAKRGVENKIEEIKLINEEIDSLKELYGEKIRTGKADISGNAPEIIDPKPPYVPPNDDDKDNAVKKEQELNEELYAEAQAKWARLEGLESEFLLGRKDRNQSFSEWKQQYDKEQYQEQSLILEQANNDEIIVLKNKYATGLITKEDYNIELYAKEQAFRLAMLELQKKYGLDTNALEQQIIDAKIRKLEKGQNEEKKILTDAEKFKQDIIKNFSETTSAALEDFTSGNKEAMKKYLADIVIMALQALKLQVQMAVTGETIQAITTLGLSAAKNIPAIIAIEAAFAAVSGLVRSTVNQFKSGKMDVIGADDGKHYNNVPYKKSVSGVITSPTLVGEQPEVVINYPTLRNIRQFNPEIIDIIKYHAVPQMASGKIPDTFKKDTSSKLDISILSKKLDVLIELFSSFPVNIKAIIDQEGVFDLRTTIEEQKNIEDRASGN